MKIFYVISFFSLVVACNTKQEATAIVIERRILPDSQLMIRYTFAVKDRIIIDSIRTKNKIISDSVTVVYSSSNPENNTLKFD